MLKRFLAYYKPHKVLFFFDMLAALLVALIAIVYPIITRTMLNDYIPQNNIRMVVICGALLLGVYIAQMRSDMFNHLEKLPYSFFDNNETGKIMSRMTNDLMDISELAHHGPENLIISTISIVASFIYLCTINWWMTLIVFACVPFLVVITMILRKRMRSAFMRSRQAVAEINASLESSVSGIRVTKAFNNAEKESQKFE